MKALLKAIIIAFNNEGNNNVVKSRWDAEW